MDVEFHNLIKVWTLAMLSLCYCFYISSRLPKGLFTLVALLPIIILFVILPLNLSSFHFCGPTSFFLTWLANFKLLLFAFDQGPLSSPPPSNLFHFISIASLPIKPKPTIIKNNNTTPIHQHKTRSSQKSTEHFAKSILFPIKVLLMAILLHLCNYKQHFHKNVILAGYCILSYLELEIILAISAIPARATFGFDLEPQFNEPYLATSLQDFWGRRWNLMVTSILRPTVYYPIRRISMHIVGPASVSTVGVIAAFVVSGLMHELIYYYLTRVPPTWEVTWFFVLQGVAVTMEVALKKAVPAKWRLHRAVSGPLALAFVAVTGVWLFFPQLVRNGVDERAIGEYFMLVDFVKGLIPLRSN